MEIQKWLERWSFNLNRTLEDINSMLCRCESLKELNERRFALLVSILENSSCLRSFLLKNPHEFMKSIQNLWYLVKTKEYYLSELKELTKDVSNDQEFVNILSYYRHRELLRIFSKEFLNVRPLKEILSEYSALPDAMLELCYERALFQMTMSFGEPLHNDGTPATGCIVALGKLGSSELNYYSDIDLMFLYSSSEGKAGKLTLTEFFTGVFQKVVKFMSSPGESGAPFLIDLDLRPFGKSGPLCVCLDSAELYYESQARQWERFALLRARYCAGDRRLFERFNTLIREPFVFRKSLDYQIIDEIRLLKSQLQLLSSKNIGYWDVKLGAGGIRELEFGLQTLVLLLGGKDPFLRESNTFGIIWRLMQKGIISPKEAKELEIAYEFLRKVEHRIQLSNCNQTHKLTDQPSVARSMLLDVEEFSKELSYAKSIVERFFSSALPAVRQIDGFEGALLFEDFDTCVGFLGDMGFSSVENICRGLFRHIRELSSKERENFAGIVKRLLEILSKTPEPDAAFSNFDVFFSNPSGKRILLSESKADFLPGLCSIFSISQYLSLLISKFPDLVEDVLTLYQEFPSPDELLSEFDRLSMRQSLEGALRRFKTLWEVRLSLLYTFRAQNSSAPLRAFVRALSDVADFILRKVMQALEADRELALIALGKLGGRELGLGSDIDIVFLSPEGDEKSQKLAQKVVSWLVKHTADGYLYQVDLRLRPMGSSGVLSPGVDFVKNYFKTTARPWEFLAWSRARFIAGREDIWEEIKPYLRRMGLSKEERLEIVAIRQELSAQVKRGEFDIKLSPGGLIDAELATQALVLERGLNQTSTLDALEILGQEQEWLKCAKRAYEFLRKLEIMQKLSGGKSIKKKHFAMLVGLTPEEFEKALKSARDTLQEVFNRVFGG
ncbi:MAG: glutamine-synthetase adenylyltransferase [Aquificaceae bacterium]